MSTIPHWLDQRAVTHADHPALIVGETVLTFAALATRAAAVSARLAALGVARGDRVALLLGNRLEFAELLHGVTRLGAVAVPLGVRFGAAEVVALLRTCRCRLLVYEQATQAVAAALPHQLVAARLALDRAALPGDRVLSDLPAAARLDLDAPHTVVFTSASSGAPKGVVLSAGNHLWNALGSACTLGVHAEDRWLACLPFHHVGGLSILLRSAIAGTTAIMHERFDPVRVNHAIDAQGVTIVSVVANMLQRLLDERGARPYPPTLRCVLLGGGPVPRALLEEAVRRGVPVAPTYGMTEAASQIATLAPRRLGGVGRPLPGVELRIAAGAPGEVGEIQVRGPSVSPGYIADGDAVIPTGEWLRTGDLGRLDGAGCLTVIGRADDLIISGGENVHPREVEQALESHPGVAEACAFGLPDPRWGEVVAACVRPRPGYGLDGDTLSRHARQRLAGFKLPRRIEVVAEFPRSPAGKILRRALRTERLVPS